MAMALRWRQPQRLSLRPPGSFWTSHRSCRRKTTNAISADCLSTSAVFCRIDDSCAPRRIVGVVSNRHRDFVAASREVFPSDPLVNCWVSLYHQVVRFPVKDRLRSLTWQSHFNGDFIRSLACYHHIEVFAFLGKA